MRLLQTNFAHPEGESMNVGFDGGIKLEFHGAKVSSNGGLLAYRDLDHALGLFNVVSKVFSPHKIDMENIRYNYFNKFLI